MCLQRSACRARHVFVPDEIPGLSGGVVPAAAAAFAGYLSADPAGRPASRDPTAAGGIYRCIRQPRKAAGRRMNAKKGCCTFVQNDVQQPFSSYNIPDSFICPAFRGQSCRWWQHPDRRTSADPMPGRSSRTRPARLRGAPAWAAFRSARHRRPRPDRR